MYTACGMFLFPLQMSRMPMKKTKFSKYELLRTLWVGNGKRLLSCYMQCNSPWYPQPHLTINERRMHNSSESYFAAQQQTD